MNNVEFLLFVSCAIVVLGGVYLIGFNFGVNWSLKKYAEIESKLKQKNGYAEEKNTWQDGDCKHCVNGCPACDARRQPNVLS